MSCKCTLVTVGARRWCVTPYARNGCAGFWVLRGSRWVRQTWHRPLHEGWT